MIIPFTSIFIRLSHLYQEFYVHGIVITNGGGGWDRWGGGRLIYNRVLEGGTGSGYYLVVFCGFFISLVLFSFVLSCALSLCFK